MLKRSLKIKWKIFLYLIGFCAILLVVLWLLQTVFLDSFYKAVKQSEVQKAAEAIARAVETGGDWQQAVLERGDLYVELYSEEIGSETVAGNRPEGMFGGVLTEAKKRELLAQARENGGTVTEKTMASDAMGFTMPEDFGSFGDLTPPEGFTPPEAPDGPEDGGWQETDGQGLQEERGFPGGEGQKGGFIPFPGGRQERETILYATIVALEGREWLLIVQAEITPVNATVQALRVQLVYISVFVLLVALALGLLIARRVAKPIETLNKSAMRLADNEYDVRFAAEGYGEIQQLSDTLNHAAGELAKTEALRRELIANVGHDLRTPLTLITGYAEMIRDIPGENTPENMQVIIDEANRLSALVADMLDLSRLQSGTGNIQLQRFDITDEVESIIARFAKLCDGEGFSVRFRYSRHATVNGDPARIAQVVYNFLVNAMTHSGPGTRIRVNQREKAGRVFIEVADSGPGIDPADLPNIWERYYKVDTQHQRSATGSGLGLSIAKSILDQHPGMEYGVRSHKGEGSVFWFSLPLTDGEE